MYSLKPTMSMFVLFILQATLSLADEIVTKPSTYEVPEGGRVVLDCEIRDNPKEVRTLWTKINKKGKDTVYAGGFKVTKDTHIGKRFENNSIEIVNANKDDEGQYECLLTIDNDSGVFTKITHALVIQYKPVMDTNPQQVEVRENTMITLNCTADGLPKPSYLWERKGKLPTSFNRESGVNTIKADPDVSGQYFCTATNPLGSISKSFTVDVRFPPEVVITETVSSDQPNVRNVICTVRANPPPEYVKLYKVGSGAFATENDMIEDETNPMLNRYTRIFTVRDEKDYGEYYCNAKNSEGERGKSHNVTMERPKPEKVQLVDFPPNGILNEESTLQWYIKSQFDIIRFDVQVNKLEQTPKQPNLTRIVMHVTTIKPKKTEENEFQGAYELVDLPTESNYQIGIKAINVYDQSSEVEVDVYLQKSSSSSAHQSLICILLILAINLYHSRNIRLH